ncbi:hypothetical protein H0486_18100 [Lachnospiraceae bacterium MD1]|uniref:Uncharacterized protein n=1 Tax=Variimorphobacter saccharofermentans TaxID=2755051 RepID=A0A839K7Z1_9FIRM|nr:hypothetical protein [Variimorphobacter saccharofermentans]MBB2184771.1 hypothetical protein [Variimorphobacter saccharofermentans]
MAKDYTDKLKNVSEKFFTGIQPTQETHNIQEEHEVQEVYEAQQVQQTQGKKGFKMQRINMAFTPDNIDFIRIMAKIKGQTMTQFVNSILDQEREAKEEVYQEAKKLIEKL